MMELKSCPHCGKEVRNLGGHIRMAHGNNPSAQAKKRVENTLDEAIQYEGEAAQNTTQGGFDPSSLGISPEVLRATVQQFIAPIIRDEVAKVASALVEQQGNLVRMQVRAELDQIAASVQEQRGTREPTTAPASAQGNQLINALAQAVIQSAAGGGQGGTLVNPNLVRQLGDLQSLTAMMWTGPMKIISDLMTLSIRSGAQPEEAAKALGKIAEDMTPKPSEKK